MNTRFRKAGKARGLLVGLAWLALAVVSQAQEPLYEFPTAEKQILYNTLIRELRCLVCQNQNLMDSNADLAADLRKKTHEMVAAGASYDEVVQYMVTRYGDFVLYRPSLKTSTIALWGLPFFCLVLVFFLIIRNIKRQKDLQSMVLSQRDLRQADKMLTDHTTES